MLTGVDKFDLRDDEWMMVEDELLQTAKLFTQHLHLAEYETLKTKMEERRKEAAARPVVSNSKPSVERRFKRKAQEQAQKQKSALREVISTHDSDSGGDEETQRAIPNRTTSSFRSTKTSSAAGAPATSRPLQTARDVLDDATSDSDDLDAPKRPPTARTSSIPLDAPVQASPARRPDIFAKPAIPSRTPNRPARTQRRDVWDDWDELNTDTKPSLPAPSPSRTPSRAPLPTNQHSSPPTTASTTPITNRYHNTAPAPSKRSTTIRPDDDLDPPKRTHLPKDTADRLTKRKSDKDREEEKKRKQKYDDIPTFLF